MYFHDPSHPQVLAGEAHGHGGRLAGGSAVSACVPQVAIGGWTVSGALPRPREERMLMRMYSVELRNTSFSGRSIGTAESIGHHVIRVFAAAAREISTGWGQLAEVYRGV